MHGGGTRTAPERAQLIANKDPLQRLEMVGEDREKENDRTGMPISQSRMERI